MKEIPNFNGNYLIDQNGNIFSKFYNKPIKQHELRKGYFRVTLYKEMKPYKLLVHRLVAETYIPNIDNKPNVNHKDGNKKNNSINNLEWVTQSENAKHAYDNKLYKRGKNIRIKQTVKDEVKKLSVNHSGNKISQILGISRSSVKRVLEKSNYPNPFN